MNTKNLTIGKEFKLRCLIYGRPGSGKTVMASTFPLPYFFDFDFGMLSLRGRDIEYQTYPHDGKEPISQFEADIASTGVIQEYIEKGKIKTIVIDSITVMQEHVLSRILKMQGKKEATLKEWSMLIDYFQAVLVSILKLPCHVIVIAHEQMIQDEITSEVAILPLIVGKKLPQQMPIFFDEVYRTIITRKGTEFEYLIQTRGDAKTMAKSRLGSLEPFEKQDYHIIAKKCGLEA